MGAVLSEKAVRDEITRVFDVCMGCRRCVDLCGVFPSLFDLLDGQGSTDAGDLSPADQDRIVDACVQCRRCVVDCPFGPARGDRDGGSVDVPRAMSAAVTMRIDHKLVPWRRRRWASVVGAAGAHLFPAGWSPFASAAEGTIRRRLLTWVTGATTSRSLPARTRPSADDATSIDPTPIDPPAHGAVTIVPSCLDTPEADGSDATVDVERLLADLGTRCERAATGCCGAPALYAGDRTTFSEVAQRNVRLLAEQPADRPVVMLQPTCAVVVSHEYERAVGADLADAARAVAARVTTPAALLLRHHERGRRLERADPGDAGTVVYHASGHEQFLDPSLPAARLLDAVGYRTDIATESAGCESYAALGADRDHVVATHERRLQRELRALGRPDRGIVTGCRLAATTIAEVTGERPGTLVGRLRAAPDPIVPPW